MIREIVQMSWLIIGDVNLFSSDISAKQRIANQMDICKKGIIAYVLFTSGSTGQPKGVPITHAGLYNRLEWMREYLKIDSRDKILHKTHLLFDVSIWEMFLPLFTGAELIILPAGEEKDPDKIVSTMIDHKITLCHFVPSMLDLFVKFVEKNIFSVNKVVCSGESLTPVLVAAFYERFPMTKLYNFYGPTEATIDVSYWQCYLAHKLKQIPIGHSAKNVLLVNLSQDKKILPIGVKGLLHIAGIQVMPGYLNQGKIVKEYFVTVDEDGFSTLQFYNTGDIVSQEHDGSFIYHGREDSQVKINGQRVDLQEIEVLLRQCVSIESAACILLSKDNVDICVKVARGHELNVSGVKTYLKKFLPNYMLPRNIFFLQDFPYLSSGKLNRNGLVSHIRALSGPKQKENLPILNVSNNENSLKAIWEHILNVDEVNFDDNFFLLGGDSIRALRLVVASNEKGLALTVESIYQNPIFSEQLSLFHDNSTLCTKPTAPFALAPKNMGGISQYEVCDIYPLASMQSGMLYHSLFSENNSYVDVFSYYIGIGYDHIAFSKAVDALVCKNSVLRTAIDISKWGQPYQVVYKKLCAQISVYDLSSDEKRRKEEYIRCWCLQEQAKPFTLPSPGLFRITVHKLANDNFHLGLTFQHVMVDGYSVVLLLKDLLSLYQQFLDVCHITEERLAYSYADYISEELNDRKKLNREYWLELLDGKSCGIFQSNSISGLTTYESIIIKEDLVVKLKEIARCLEIEPVAIYLSVSQYIFQMLFSNADLCLGVVLHNRLAVHGGEKMVGMFLNVLPFCAPQSTPCWERYLKKIYSKYRKLQLKKSDRFYDVKNIFENLNIPVLFNYINFEEYKVINDNCRFSIRKNMLLESGSYSMTVNCIEDAITRRLQLKFVYNAEIYSRDKIDYIISSHRKMFFEIDDIISNRVPLPYLMPPKHIQLPAEKIIKKRSESNFPVEDMVVDDAATREEKILLEIWAVIFEKPVVATQNFYEIGGDSMKAIRLVGMSRKHGVFFTIEILNSYPTIQQLKNHLTLKETEYMQGLEESAELSIMQEHMFLFNNKEKEHAIYKNVFAYDFCVDVSVRVILKAMSKLYKNHPILTTTYLNTPTGISRYFDRNMQPKVNFLPCCHVMNNDIENIVSGKKQITYDFNQHLIQFDFSRYANKYLLVVSFQHSLLDGWSLAQILTDLVALCRGEDVEDFSQLEMDVTQTALTRSGYATKLKDPKYRECWKNSIVAQKSGKKRFKDFNFKHSSLALPAGLLVKFEVIITKLKIPLKSLLMAIHFLSLSEAFEKTKITSMVVVVNRPAVEHVEKVAGLFTNFVPFNVTVEKNSTLILVQKLFSDEVSMRPYQDYPYPEILDLNNENRVDFLFNYTEFSNMNSARSAVIPIYVFEEFPFNFAAHFSRNTTDNQFLINFTFNLSEISMSLAKSIPGIYSRVVDSVVNELLEKI